jgi:hypothetical protein
MRTITLHSEYSHLNGVLLPVKARVQEVPDAAYADFCATAIDTAITKIIRIFETKIPNYCTFHHPQLGPLGFFFGDKSRGLFHLLRERDEAHERTPDANLRVADALREIATAAILGTPVHGLPGSPKSDTPRISLIHGNHQVIVEPFWKNNQGNIQLPIDKNQAWVITGYQMEARRQQDMQDWLASPKCQVAIQRTVQK